MVQGSNSARKKLRGSELKYDKATKTYKCATWGRELDEQTLLKLIPEPHFLHDSKDERRYWQMQSPLNL